MELIHFTKEDSVDLNRTYEQGDIEKGGFGKPTGMWISDEDSFGWSQWCRAENFHVEHLKNAFSVKLKDNANILHIRTVEELDAFNETYKCPMFKIHPELSSTMMTIDWEAVAEQYSGILITPYLWERRLHMDYNFYYGWDCASGCIWNSDAIESIELIPDYELPEEEEV